MPRFIQFPRPAAAKAPEPAATAQDWYRVRNVGPGEAEIVLYGEIGVPKFGDTYDDVFNAGGTFTQFKRELDALGTVSRLTVRIFSPGGFVWDALAIRDTLRSHPAQVTAVIEGLAASAATIVAMAADRIEMPANAYLMIHNAVAWADGDHRSMIEMADRLEKWTNNIADIYASRIERNCPGAPHAEVMADLRAKMDAETYFTGTEARDYGLVDLVTDEVSLAACVRGLDRPAGRLDPDRMPAPLRALFDTLATDTDSPTETESEEPDKENLTMKRSPVKAVKKTRNTSRKVASQLPDEEETTLLEEEEEETTASEEEEEETTASEEEEEETTASEDDDEIEDEDEDDPEDEEDEDETPASNRARAMEKTIARAVAKALKPMAKRLDKIEGKRRAGVKDNAWGNARPAKRPMRGLDEPLNMEGKSPLQLIHIGRAKMQAEKRQRRAG